MTLAPLVGFIAGIVVGLTSMGGGALLTPMLVYVLGIPPSLAVGSDVFIASGIKVFSGGVYALRKQVDWRLAGTLALGSVPGAFVGVALLNRIPPEFVEIFVSRGLGFAMLLAATATIRRVFLKQRPVVTKAPPAPVTVAIGFGTGLLVSLTSVGSGSLLCCILFQFYPLATPMLVGTDLVHALALSAAASVGHAASGRVDLALASSVLVGAIPGAILGARIAGKIPEKTLRVGLASVLAIIGLKMALGPGGVHSLSPVQPAYAEAKK